MNKETDSKDKKLSLIMLPYWTPLNIPLGIVCLQTYLRENGYNADAFDFNGETEYWNIFYNYMNQLKMEIDPSNSENFINSAHYVLKQHLFLYINREKAEDFDTLFNKIVYYVFFQKVSSKKIAELNECVKLYFDRLEKDMVELLERQKPDIVGFSVYTGTLPSTVFSIKLIRERYPEIKIIFGGGIFSSDLAVGSDNYNRFVQNSGIDKMLVGEGEKQILEFAEGKLDLGPINIAKNMIELESVDLTKMDLSNFQVDNYTYIPLFASRSCPFQCKFCSETILWGKFRMKDAKVVANEFEYIFKNQKKQLFLMCDSLLNPYIDQMSEELNKKDISVYWDGYLRAGSQASDFQRALSWRMAGFYRARIGAESGSPRVLKLMNKKITVDDIKNSVRNLAKAGIKTTTYWVVGYPGETEEDFMETLNVIEELKDDIYQAECNKFEYFDCGQSGSDEWGKYKEKMYTEKELEALQMQRWILHLEPDAKTIHDRAVRFVAHCKKLGIPNPYSARELYFADKRWKELHALSVPSLADFRNQIVMEDNEKFKRGENK